MKVAAQSIDPDVPVSTRVFASLLNAENCVTIAAREWADAPDDADQVARAVAYNCQEAIQRVGNTQQQADRASGNASKLYDQVTGREVGYNDWAFAKLERVAMSRVVEARARKCRPPR